MSARKLNVHADNCKLFRVICDLFTNDELRSSQELVETCPFVPDRIEIWKCWFLRRGENRSTQRKTSPSKGENQQQTQPIHGADYGILTNNPTTTYTVEHNL